MDAGVRRLAAAGFVADLLEPLDCRFARLEDPEVALAQFLGDHLGESRAERDAAGRAQHARGRGSCATSAGTRRRCPNSDPRTPAAGWRGGAGHPGCAPRRRLRRAVFQSAADVSHGWSRGPSIITHLWTTRRRQELAHGRHELDGLVDVDAMAGIDRYQPCVRAAPGHLRQRLAAHDAAVRAADDQRRALVGQPLRPVIAVQRRLRVEHLLRIRR